VSAACKGTILLVDDTFYIRVMLKKLLEPLGFHTLEAENGRIAQEVYEAQPDFIDLILMDIGMPEQDGLTTLENIRKINPTQAVIMLTAQSTEQLLVECARLGISGFFAKPVDHRKLRAKVVEVISSGHQERPGTSLAILDPVDQFRFVLEESLNSRYPSTRGFSTVMDLYASHGDDSPDLVLTNAVLDASQPVVHWMEEIRSKPKWEQTEFLLYRSQIADVKAPQGIFLMQSPFRMTDLFGAVEKLLEGE